MPETLPLAKPKSQGKLCSREIDSGHGDGDYGGMGSHDDDTDAKLYLTEWLDVFEMRKRELANESGVSEPYISQLANNRKENPSRKKLGQIAGALGITVKDLYSPPPSRQEIERVRQLPLGLISRLQQRRKAG